MSIFPEAWSALSPATRGERTVFLPQSPVWNLALLLVVAGAIAVAAWFFSASGLPLPLGGGVWLVAFSMVTVLGIAWTAAGIVDARRIVPIGLNSRTATLYNYRRRRFVRLNEVSALVLVSRWHNFKHSRGRSSTKQRQLLALPKDPSRPPEVVCTNVFFTRTAIRALREVATLKNIRFGHARIDQPLRNAEGEGWHSAVPLCTRDEIERHLT